LLIASATGTTEIWKSPTDFFKEFRTDLLKKKKVQVMKAIMTEAYSQKS